MKNYKYPSLSEFIKQSNLTPNQNISTIVDGNLLSNNLKFQDLESELLFVSLSVDSDCAAISLNNIRFLELHNKQAWYKEIYDSSKLIN